MKITEVLSNTELTSKEKIEVLSDLLIKQQITVKELLNFADTAKDSVKATCIEAVELATKTNSDLLDVDDFDMILYSLESKAPRVKWESAKVIANTIQLFQDRVAPTTDKLLANAKHEGVVVRHSVASALESISKLKTLQGKNLQPIIEKLHAEEIKNSIKNIYQRVIANIKK